METVVAFSTLVMATVAVITLFTSEWKSGKWRSAVDSHIRNLQSEVRNVQRHIINIWRRLDGEEPLFYKNSPMKLSKRGKELADELNLDKIANKSVGHAIYVISFKATKDQKDIDQLNAYDLEEECFRYVHNDLIDHLKEESPEEFRNLFNTAYDKGLAKEEVLQIIGILLLERILESKNTPRAESQA